MLLEASDPLGPGAGAGAVGVGDSGGILALGFGEAFGEVG